MKKILLLAFAVVSTTLFAQDNSCGISEGYKKAHEDYTRYVDSFPNYDNLTDSERVTFFSEVNARAIAAMRQVSTETDFYLAYTSIPVYGKWILSDAYFENREDGPGSILLDSQQTVFEKLKYTHAQMVKMQVFVATQIKNIYFTYDDSYIVDVYPSVVLKKKIYEYTPFQVFWLTELLRDRMKCTIAITEEERAKLKQLLSKYQCETAREISSNF